MSPTLSSEEVAVYPQLCLADLSVAVGCKLRFPKFNVYDVKYHTDKLQYEDLIHSIELVPMNLNLPKQKCILFETEWCHLLDGYVASKRLNL